MAYYELPHILDWPRCELDEREQWLPGRAGVYALIDESDERVYYIGKAEMLSSRWRGRTHHRLEQAENELEQPQLAWQVCDGRSITQIENRLIKEYSPDWNYSPVPTYRSGAYESTKSVRDPDALTIPEIIFSLVVAVLIGNFIGHWAAYVIGYFVGAAICYLCRHYLKDFFQ